jgi:hypothetical protein
MKKPTFVPTSNGVKNVSSVRSLIHDESFTLGLDLKCNVICFENGETAFAMFEQLQQAIKPAKDYSIILENGSFIDPAVIAEIFISPKTQNLLITGVNGKLLYMYKSTTFSNLDGLLSELSDRLLAVGSGKPAAVIQWAEFK